MATLHGRNAYNMLSEQGLRIICEYRGLETTGYALDLIKRLYQNEKTLHRCAACLRLISKKTAMCNICAKSE
jgi:hypothetical protein